MTDRLPIPGYEGYYEADQQGRIFSVERWVIGPRGVKQFVPARERKLSRHGTGYLTVRLAKDGVVKTHRVHRLVAKTFIPNPMNLPEINHRDGDKHHNAVLQQDGSPQLEWCDGIQNMEHAVANALTAKGERNSGAKLSNAEIEVLLDRCLAGELVSAVAKERGVNRNTLTRAFYRTSRADAWRKNLTVRRSRAGEIRHQKGK